MIFIENDKDYSLEVSTLLSPEEVQKGLWLVMAGVDDIPPHIALINDGLYYSVSAKKVETGAPIANFFKAISKKNVPTLFIGIESPLQERFRGAEIFSKHPLLGSGDHSCLWPVRDVFAQLFSEKYSKATLVFELLAMAQKDNLLVECKSIFLTPSPLGGNQKGIGRVRLNKYTHAQIRERINSILLNS